MDGTIPPIPFLPVGIKKTNGPGRERTYSLSFRVHGVSKLMVLRINFEEKASETGMNC
jgi:hypothetical protein